MDQLLSVPNISNGANASAVAAAAAAAKIEKLNQALLDDHWPSGSEAVTAVMSASTA